uniref:Protein kinase domain-containing protein n=1 Tax=Fagus sylvatica TaxID=28930 RepID=A0A2N9G988_FAGSY
MGLSQLSSAPPSSRTSSFCMSTFILFWWCGLLVTSVVSGNNETDRLALLEFKAKITLDPFGVTTSWNDSIHFCQWRGVTCGRRHQRVTMLDLRSLKLVGSISPHVGNLSFLRNLTLLNNTFHNEIPPEIGHLRRLRVLRLENNTLSGKIPCNLSACTKLQGLLFNYNQLIGEIPPTLGTLSKLRGFSILRNNLTGSIPPFFGNLSFLGVFGVNENNLGGIIPDSFGQLTKLLLFSVAENRLSGTIPPSIFNLSSLTIFDVGLNQIQGSLPSDIGITLPNIKYLSIFSNQFTGSIPVSISNASNLYLLQLNDNNLSGKVPSLEKINRMNIFNIGWNNLGNGGENDLSFLCSLTNSSNLTSLVININNFGGELPKCVANFSTTLIDLVLEDNKIFGNIPNGIGNLINLQRLMMNQNKLSGENNLQGNIPLSLSKCQNLFLLNLTDNNLSGLISSQIIASLGSCVKLEYLAMGSNLFQGIIPPSLRSLRGLEILDLSDNNLSGQIPKFLEQFVFLQLLNLSHNHFEGEVSTNGVFKNTSRTLIMANGELCGGIPKFQLPKCKDEKSKKKRKLTLTLKLIISIFFGLLGVTLVFSILLLFSLRKKRKENTSSDSGNLLLNLSYQSLLNATQGFSSTNLIGAGSFGSVYKGILNQGRQTVAVKVLNLSRHGASKSFKAECEALRNIRHRNLVKVLTSCSGIDNHGHDFKALVMEFMGNGSLDEWLHPTPRIK